MKYVCLIATLCLCSTAIAGPFLGPFWIVDTPTDVIVSFSHGASVNGASDMLGPFNSPSGFWRVPSLETTEFMFIRNRIAYDAVDLIATIQHRKGPHPPEGAGPVFEFAFGFNAADNGPVINLMDVKPPESHPGLNPPDSDLALAIVRGACCGPNSTRIGSFGLTMEVHHIPEPGTVGIVGLGLGLLLFRARRIRRRSLILLSAIAVPAAVLPLSAQSGSVEARMSIFSGRPDPKVTFTGAGIETLRSFLVSLPPAPTPDWPVAGYRGFHLVNRGTPNFPLSVRVLRGTVEVTGTPGAVSFYYRDSRGLEAFLSRLFPPIQTPAGPAPAAARNTAGTGLPVSGDEPPYQPENWNKEPVRSDNNCYNYACNKPTNTFAQPGRASGRNITTLNCSSVLTSALWDGLIMWNADAPCPKCFYKVALAVWPGMDYHWYRQDQSGNWSQKHGDGPATSNDDRTPPRPLTDPRDAGARGFYTDFCGFFCAASDSASKNIQ